MTVDLDGFRPHHEGPRSVVDVDEETVGAIRGGQQATNGRAQRLVVLGHHQHRYRLPIVLRGPDDDVADEAVSLGAGAVDAGAHQAVAQRERNAVPPSTVDRALVDANNLLGPARVVAHHQTAALAFRTEHERHLGAEAVLERRRHQRRHRHAEQPRQPRLFLQQLLGVRDTGQAAAAADAEVFTVHGVRHPSKFC